MIVIWVLLGVALLFGGAAFFGAPYVPTLHGELRQAFTELYAVGSHDVVVDMGAGDGQVLLEAVRRGAQAVGYEVNPLLVVLSKLRLRNQAKIRLQDMWTATLPDDVTLVYVFSVSRDAARLTRRFNEEATRLGRPLTVMTFGAGLAGLQPERSRNGHSIYIVKPLQP